MTRALAALAGALLLAGCPIPQAVPDYPPGAITPPRIVVNNATSQISHPATVIRVPVPSCAPWPEYALSATLRHTNTIDPIVARWFVNYEPGNDQTVSWEHDDEITEVDPNDPTLRTVPPWTFRPYGYPSYGNGLPTADGALHVVELVVSNGFDPDGVPTNRSPQPGFEVQLYRWVFLNRAADPCPPP